MATIDYREAWEWKFGPRRTGPHTPVAGHGHSLPVGRVAGIPLRLHWTFFLLIAFAVAVEWSEGEHAVVTGLVWIVALFTSVVAHEVAHCVVARRRGAHVLGIVLFPSVACHRLTPCQRRQLTSWPWPLSDLWPVLPSE